MDQSKDYTLHSCKSDIKKIGHILDASLLNVSAEAYNKQQISMIGNLSLTQPLFGAHFFLQNTSHFETLQTLQTLTLTYYFKKNINPNSSINYSKLNDNLTLTSKVAYQE